MTTRRPRDRRPRPPSVALLAIPFGAAGLAVVLAAGHAALGSPLGPAFAGELWDLAKSLGVMLVAWGPLAGYARRANMAAIAAADPTRSLPTGGAHSGDDDANRIDAHGRLGGARPASPRKRRDLVPPDDAPTDRR